MEIDIVRKNDNLLLERTEVDFTVKHSKESTPSRKDLSEALREELMLKKEILVVDSFGSEFGRESQKERQGCTRIWIMR
jgi:ribosomal protein S24E